MSSAASCGRAPAAGSIRAERSLPEMALYWSYLLADYYALLESVTAVTICIIMVCSFDDLFIDAWYWIRETSRALTVKRRFAALTADQLHARSEQPLAIMVPAWLEYDVISQMIENMVSTLDYRNYVIFVGTYVNDAATIAEVERMRSRYRQLVRVEVPHPGPTCKADCLNWVVQAIFLHARTTNIDFAGVVLHDSEDVLHPLELKYFNYLLPRKDLIQIPVLSLPRDWNEWVACTYMDEFAEWHGKDLVVRESMANVVPSAGVGTCFSIHALQILAADTDNQPFNTQSLTEDYDIGERLAARGLKSIFCRFPVDYTVRRKILFGLAGERSKHLVMPLCVREFFPSTFRAAYRQKARWTLGIGLQGWQQFGWSGSLAKRYLLLRDRKGVFTSFVPIVAYGLAAQFMAFYIAVKVGAPILLFPSLFETSEWLVDIIYINAFMLCLRAVQRFYFVNRVYGWEHGLLSIPRMVVANFVNCMATARAWRIFLSHLFLGTRIVWDKTMHAYPSADAMASDRKRLGELLVSWRVLDDVTLDRALEEQTRHELPLGRMLVSRGVLDEETLAEAISFQSGLPRARLTPADVEAHAEVLAVDLCVRLRLAPFGRTDDGRLRIAAVGPLHDLEFREITRHLRHAPDMHVARESEIAAALRLMRGDEGAFDAVASGSTIRLLGDLLIERGAVRRDVLRNVLDEYKPEAHGRIGHFLVERGIVTAAVVDAVVDFQRSLLGRDVHPAT
jgi:adsorption protein B